MKFRKIIPRSSEITEAEFEVGKLYRCIGFKKQGVGNSDWIGGLCFKTNEVGGVIMIYGFHANKNLYSGYKRYFGSQYVFKEVTEKMTLVGKYAYSDNPWTKEFN